MRKLVKLPNSLLRQRSKEVKKVDSVKELAQEMVEFMQNPPADSPIPIGLSAVQLGELVRVIAFRLNPYSTEPSTQVLINPEVVYQKGSHVVYESCFCIPGKKFALKRAKLVKIRGLTLDGVMRSFRGSDLLAQVFQHELNHIDGILIDTLGKERR